MTFPSHSSVVLIGKETTKGTPVSATKDIGIVQEIAPNFSREVLESLGLSSIEALQVTAHSLDLGGTARVEFQHGRLMEYIFGSVGHATTGSDTTHTFTISDDPPSFTLENSENMTTDVVLKDAGCMIDSAEFSGGLNQNLQLRIDYKCITTASSASSSAAVESTLTVFPQAMQHILLNAVEATEVQSFSIRVSKKIERSYGLGTVLAQQIQATELRIEFQAQLGFANVTFQELYLGGTSPASSPAAATFEMNCHNGVTLGSGRRQVQVVLGNCYFTTFSKNKSIGNLVFIDLAGKGTLTSAISVDNIPSGSW